MYPGQLRKRGKRHPCQRNVQNKINCSKLIRLLTALLLTASATKVSERKQHCRNS